VTCQAIGLTSPLLCGPLVAQASSPVFAARRHGYLSELRGSLPTLDLLSESARSIFPATDLMPPGCRSRNRDVQNVSISYCFSCNEMCLWVYDQLVWPRRAGGSEPKHLAPPNVRREYEETSQTLEASPRGAAARSRSANCAPAFSKADGPAGGQPCEAVCRAEDVWEHLRQSETTCFRSCVGLVSDVGGAIFVDGARLCSSWLASRRQHKKARHFAPGTLPLLAAMTPVPPVTLTT
jgi:hypothetical protein